jgi:hypothetical protein
LPDSLREQLLISDQLADLKKLIWHYKLPDRRIIEDESNLNIVLKYLSDLTIHADESTRILVCKTLAGAKDSAYAHRLLLRLLCDKSEVVSWWAFLAFPSEKLDAYYTDVATIIGDKYLSSHSRAFGVHLIRGTDNASLAQTMLTKYLFDIDETITGYASEYLGWYKFHEYQPRFIELFEHDNVNIKVGAMLGLGYLKYSKRAFVKQVIQLLDDPRKISDYPEPFSVVGQSASVTLRNIGTRQALKANSRWTETWIQQTRGKLFLDL